MKSSIAVLSPRLGEMQVVTASARSVDFIAYAVQRSDDRKPHHRRSSLGALLACCAAACTVWLRFQACYEEQVDDFDRPVFDRDRNGAPRGIDRQKLRMSHPQRPTLRQVNLKGTERLGPMHFAKLLDGHIQIVARADSPIKNRTWGLLLSRNGLESFGELPRFQHFGETTGATNRRPPLRLQE